MDRVRSLAVIGAVLSVLTRGASVGYAAQPWLSWDARGVSILDPVGMPASPAVGVLSGGLAGFKATVSTPGLSAKAVVNQTGRFVELAWPDAPMAGAIGAPGIPVVRRLFIAPVDADLAVSYDADPAIVIDAAALGTPLQLLPMQPPIPITPGAVENAQFQYDASAYALDAALPAERAVIEELGIVRGQRLCLLEVRPLAYNPWQQRVSVYPHIVVRVDFVGRGHVPSTLSPLPGLRSIVLNPDLLPPRGLRGDGNYLILVPSRYESAIASFADAKVSQGYTVSTHVLADDMTKYQIKSYIMGLWGGPDAPAYILLVGDTDTIPCWIGVYNHAPTDLYYACMNGPYDWYPDIAIGRFPVRNDTQLANIVDKTLYYETGPLADPNYPMRAVFMASENYWQSTEGTHNWVIDNYMTPSGVAADKLYCHTYGATTQQVHDAFNNGRLFGIYAGYGDPTQWADGPHFDQDDVNNLANQNLYAFVGSFTALTGDFSVEECFLETWLRAANKGAVAAWGASILTTFDYMDILEKKLFDSIYDPNDDVVPEAGPVINDTKLRLLEHYGPTVTTRDHFEMYNLLGDPALPLDGPQVPAQGLWTTPATGFTPEGQPGGPFTPPSVDYLLTNQNDTPLNYTVTKTADWLTITSATGTVPPQSSVVVTVALNALAGAMPAGVHTDTLVFTNLTDHEGDTTRPVRLTVGVAILQYSFNLDTNPGWTVAGQWAFGQPTGQGGASHGYPDPTSGATGINVFGVNLNGNYSTAIGGPYWLTAGPVDLANATDSVLRFQRWLNTDYQPYVSAMIEVSNDGANWTQLWINGTEEIAQHEWGLRSYDIHAVADHQAGVYVRWGHSVNQQYAAAYSGWNIDDVEFWGKPDAPAYPLGDVNCDFALDFGDINPFVLLLADPLAWATAYPACPLLNGDINADGAVNFQDINPFVALLTGQH